ncbi:hypothetical protein HK405_010328 [Cladochytrium tenue]|nr:hypothetical protein HK405_010328 [Cladochytrium tenue]
MQQHQDEVTKIGHAPPHFLGLASPRFAAFDISWTTYKHIPLAGSDGSSHALKVYVMVPKRPAGNASPADADATSSATTEPPPQAQPPRKVLAKFHGGGRVAGAALYPDAAFPPWLLALALQQDAVIVAPNYRLLPESSGADVLEDLRDFWRWVAAAPDREEEVEAAAEEGGTGIHRDRRHRLPSQSLRAHVIAAHPNAQLDLTRVVAVGQSAGGYLALQSALTVGRWFRADSDTTTTTTTREFTGLRAVIAAYPGGVDPDAVGRAFVIPNAAARAAAAAAVERHLQLRPNGVVVSEVVSPERRRLLGALVRSGLYMRHAGARDNAEVWLLNRIQQQQQSGYARPLQLPPPQLILHGEDDSVVPVGSSVKYVEEANKLWGPGVVDLVVRPGEHGFDIKLGLDEEWLREKLDKFVQLWNL